MDHGNERQCPFDFVALEVSDEVPADGREDGGFSPELLRAAFAEIAHAEFGQECGDLTADRFRDRDQRDFASLAAGARAGGAHPLVDGGESVGK